MFIAELRLYINYLKEEIANEYLSGHSVKKEKYYSTFCQNLKDGISYYRTLCGVAASNRDSFDIELQNAETELNQLFHRRLFVKIVEQNHLHASNAFNFLGLN